MNHQEMAKNVVSISRIVLGCVIVLMSRAKSPSAALFPIKVFNGVQLFTWRSPKLK